MKLISVRTPNGKLGVPLKMIAEDRTKYYAEQDDFERDSPEWNTEFNYIMEDDFEGIDWFQNNMDWDDVKDAAVVLDDKDFCDSRIGTFDYDSVELVEIAEA